MEAVNEPTMLLEIERELAGPEKNSALAKYDAVLVALERRLEIVPSGRSSICAISAMPSP